MWEFTAVMHSDSAVMDAATVRLTRAEERDSI